MTEHIRYSKRTGFTGITPKDKEQWVRKYPHIDDFELTVQEGEGWLSKQWGKERLAEQKPRDFLDWWLGCEWENLSKDKYKEPEKICNPKQLSNLIDHYFISGELIKRITRGKHDGYSDTLATNYYEKALGHAVKLREEVPDFPQTPDAIGKPHLDLRRLQEWCIECQRIEKDLLARLTLDYVEEALSLLQELRELLKSGCPPIDETKWGGIKDRIWSELKRLIKVVKELDEPKISLKVTLIAEFEYKMQYWHTRAILSQDCEPLLSKMTKHKIQVPDDPNELAEMITAAEWMAKVDWDKAEAIVEGQEGSKATDITLNERIDQMSLLRTAQMAEEKIHEIIWKIYCHENQEYTEAVNKRQGQIDTLFHKAVDILNSDETLLKVAYLRDDKLASSFKSLGDSLFNISTVKIDYDNVLHDIIDELEAIRDDAEKYDVFTKPAETEQKIKPVKDSKKTTSDWRSIPIPELITKGESHTVEFKETLQYNIQTKKLDYKVFNSSLKTIAAFLNADGGTLLIGVSDSSEIMGIERDKKAMGRADNDRFQLKIRDTISGQNSRFTPAVLGNVEISFKGLNEMVICRIDVQPLPASEIQHFDRKVYFRDGNRTIELTGPDLTNWIKRRNK